jgi:phosphoenolpyruvate-protein kinase (PTS system EI component)
MAETRIFTGRAGAPGRARGAAFAYCAGAEAAGSLEALFAAAAARLDAARSEADDTLAPLLDAQRLMLDDPELRDGAAAGVAAGHSPAAAARAAAEALAAMLDAADSPYFRERAIDVRALGTLLAETARPLPPAGAVVLADELSPLDTADLAKAGVCALVTRRGGPTCHAAIIARAWGIPAVVGAPDAILAIPDGALVLVDGDAGRVTVHPGDDDVIIAAPAVHLARRVPVYANIGDAAEVTRAVRDGAEGIGLLRSEFLFQHRATAPTEDEQAAVYNEIAQAMGSRPVTVRTLDIGADKPVPFLPMEAEPNPQLGLRGIRLCLQREALFRTQLRALIRAGVRVMLPMVTAPAEVTAARVLLAEEAASLGLPAPPLGVMIEVPMAALAAPELAAVSDFFSLGTNDLLQFLLAADRQHAGVGYLYDDDPPAVWRLLANVIDAAHAAGIPVGVCGEWGADPTRLPRLLDLGLDTVSVAAGAVARVRGWFAD